jgi:hypothetical protein
VHKVEILAARLADNLWVGAVAIEAARNLAPDRVEGARAAGEVQPGKVAVPKGDRAEHDAVAGQKVDDARRQAGLLEDLRAACQMSHKKSRHKK